MTYLIFAVLMTLPFATSLSAEPKAAGPATNALIAKVIAAYGGESVIKRTKRVYAKGTTNAIMRGDAGSYERWFDRDRKLRVETLYAKSSETRILNGSRGWRSVNNEKPVEVNSFPYTAMVYQFKQLDLPFGLMTGQFRITDLGEVTQNGRQLHVLVLEDNEGPPVRAYIDLTTYYIFKTEAFFQIKGNVTSLGAEFMDFKTFDGMPLPTRIINYGGGQKIGETDIKKYQINPDMKDSLFKP